VQAPLILSTFRLPLFAQFLLEDSVGDARKVARLSCEHQEARLFPCRPTSLRRRFSVAAPLVDFSIIPPSDSRQENPRSSFPVQPPHSSMSFRVFLVSPLLVFGVCDARATFLSDCDVQDILELQELPSGSLTMDSYGDLTVASAVLVPMSLDPGRYKITVSRKTEDVYVVEGEGLYLRTSYCSEYATSKSAVLEVASGQYSSSTLYFFD